ncbi:hypothetical protein [Maribacter sp. 2210JD10-5]|uniref:hypothetical protein n=1 Tax=Maribacter sp. 2210JD10-5 TaxID=3386272 RepID=UPI0039BCA345
MRYRILAVLLLIIGHSVSAQSDNCPCCTENHGSFDFWLGTWEVTNANGTKAGNNTITKLQQGCILKEEWIGIDGKNTGTSLNFFNLKTKQWEQLWVDNSGTHLKLKGNRSGNQMILTSDSFEHKDGNMYVDRITWTNNPDGTVRQLWEVLQGEKVVSVAFDGLYKRVKE